MSTLLGMKPTRARSEGGSKQRPAKLMVSAYNAVTSATWQEEEEDVLAEAYAYETSRDALGAPRAFEPGIKAHKMWRDIMSFLRSATLVLLQLTASSLPGGAD